MLDSLTINFDPDSFLLLNLLLALMMFGASLSVKLSDFKFVLSSPKAPAIGLLCQFVFLPPITFLVTRVLQVDASVALGMILVASCPGGSFSNIMTWLARGDMATSVSMTGVSTLAALIMTPLNFSFYASLNPDTSAILARIAVEPSEVMELILLVLVVPLISGMLVGQRFPELASRMDRPFRWVSMLLFLVFVAVAFTANGDLFLRYAQFFVGLVILHNAIALLLGYLSARLIALDPKQARAVTLEVGIQNSGLGLIIVFNFFPELGGMMIITAFWGVWHLVSGLALALFWSKRPTSAVDAVG
ncbi:MAG: symporter [Pseudohongiella sp.]|nr:MAG: symporter [Pseudohongiella sp.]